MKTGNQTATSTSNLNHEKVFSHVTKASSEKSANSHLLNQPHAINSRIMKTPVKPQRPVSHTSRANQIPLHQ